MHVRHPLSIFLSATFLIAAVACGDGAPNADGDDSEAEQEEDEAPGGLPPGVIDHAGDGTVNGGENGQPSPDENSDADGFCFSPELGYYECDDGADPGTGIPGFDDPILGGDGDSGDGDGPGDGDSGDGDGPGDGDSGDGDGPGDGDSGDGDGDGPGDGDGDGPGGDAICTEEVFLTATDTPARILLVVDKSGSMEDDAVGYPGSKWDGAKDALSDVVEATEDSIAYGLMRYPDGNANQNVCSEGSLDVGVNVGTAGAIIDDLDSTSPGGGTPTAATLQEARQVLDNLGDEGGNRAVVLATDGGPNCNTNLNVNTCQCMIDTGCDDARNCLDDDNAIAAAESLNASGYAVFVIGIPGSEDYTEVLNGLAQAGGTAAPGATSYYDADDTTQLAEALADIVTRVATCRFDLAQAPQPGSMELRVNGTPVAHDPTRSNGWDLVDNNTIELFGNSCNIALAGDVEIDVDYCYSTEG